MRAFIVELQNRPGGLAALAEAIAERGINITNLAGVTCGGSGSVGLLTNDEASTKTVLDGGSFSYRQIDLISAALEDKPFTSRATPRTSSSSSTPERNDSASLRMLRPGEAW